MKTIRQALRQRARRFLSALFAEMASLTSARRNAASPLCETPRVVRRRVDARPWPKVRGIRRADRRHHHT